MNPCAHPFMNYELITESKTESVVPVDYSRSLEVGIAAGQYEKCSRYLTDKHLPVIAGGMGKKEMVVALYEFTAWRETKLVALHATPILYQMEHDGNRPATPSELLAFGDANPDIQRTFPIIALSPVHILKREDDLVAYLAGGRHWRGIGLDGRCSAWNSATRFLAVRK